MSFGTYPKLIKHVNRVEIMSKLIDISGQRFGFWEVLNNKRKNKSGQIQWLCKCECGIEKFVTANSLKTGNSTSCGCNHISDLSNKKFSKLSVLEPDYSKGRRLWKCVCDCGSIIITCAFKLKNSITTSCDKCLNEKPFFFREDNFCPDNDEDTIQFSNIDELCQITSVKEHISKKYFHQLSIVNDIIANKLSINVIYKLIAEYHNGYTYRYVGDIGLTQNQMINLWNDGFHHSINDFKSLNLPIFEDKWKKITHPNVTPLATILNKWGGIDANPDIIQPLILKLQLEKKL